MSLLVLYILVVLPVAVVGGTGLAVVASILGVVVFAYLFVPPIHSVRGGELRGLAGMVVFLLRRWWWGSWRPGHGARPGSWQALARSGRPAAGGDLVARAGPPSLVFEAVTGEVGLLCDADLARMERYEDDGTVTGVAVWGRVPAELAVGMRLALDGVRIARGVRESGGPGRVDRFGEDAGAIATEARAVGIRSLVGCPIVVGGGCGG